MSKPRTQRVKAVKAWAILTNGELWPGLQYYTRKDALQECEPGETVIRVEIRPLPTKRQKP